MTAPRLPRQASATALYTTLAATGGATAAVPSWVASSWARRPFLFQHRQYRGPGQP